MRWEDKNISVRLARVWKRVLRNKTRLVGSQGENTLYLIQSITQNVPAEKQRHCLRNSVSDPINNSECPGEKAAALFKDGRCLCCTGSRLFPHSFPPPIRGRQEISLQRRLKIISILVSMNMMHCSG